MPRFKEDYSLYPRRFKNTTIYYYRTYYKDGKRTSGKSTGCTTRTAAKTYCNALLKKGKLIFEKVPTFGEFARDYWNYDKCPYIKGRLARGFSITKRYADNQRMNFNQHILPTFGNLKLSQITAKMIDNWLLELSENGLAGSTVNQCLSALRPIFTEVQRAGLIDKTPAKGIKPL